jgi:uncharacterized protein YndB with AHSA1/START domain
MVRNEHEILLGVSADEVFAAVSDLEGWSRWRPSEGQLDRTTPGPIGAGTTWQAGGRVMDEQIAVTIEVTAYEPPARFGLRVSGSIQAEQTFTVEPGADGTRLVMVLELADPHLAEPARQQWDSDLRALTALLETER